MALAKYFWIVVALSLMSCGSPHAQEFWEEHPDTTLVVHEWGVEFGGPFDNIRAAPMGADGVPHLFDPFIYVYARDEMDIEVSVSLLGGESVTSIDETWPERPQNLSVSWSASVTPEPCDSPSPFPQIGEGQCTTDYLGFCQVASLERAVTQDASCLNTDNVSSPFLMYAGERLSDLYQHRIVAYRESGYQIENRFDEPIGPLIFIESTSCPMDAEPDCAMGIVATWIDEIGAKEVATYPIEVTAHHYDENGEIQRPPQFRDLENRIVSLLVVLGLTQGESESFMNVWRPFLFRTTPSQPLLIYPLPRWYVEQSASLEIHPVPDESVRVFLAFEYLSPPFVDDETQ